MESLIANRIIFFFINYNKLRSKIFKVLAPEGREKAIKLIKKGMHNGDNS